MRKKVKRYGNTLVFQFSIEEQANYAMNEGDVFEIEMTKLDIDVQGKSRRGVFGRGR